MSKQKRDDKNVFKWEDHGKMFIQNALKTTTRLNDGNMGWIVRWALGMVDFERGFGSSSNPVFTNDTICDGKWTSLYTPRTDFKTSRVKRSRSSVERHWMLYFSLYTEA